MTGPQRAASLDATIVMAVYNGMPYVRESLESLLGQTLASDRYEVIAVDDGSTDDTLTVLREMAQAHPNMVVVPMPHTGSPAAPRNAGVDLARGRFILFFDADDVLAPYALEEMVRAADANGVDIVLPKQRALGARAVPIQAFRATLPRTDVFSSQDIYRVLGPVKLFRTSFIREHGFRFPEGMRRKSDVPFGVETYLAARGITVLADRDYVHVRLRDDGGNLTVTRKSLHDHLPVVRFVFDTVGKAVPPGFRRDRLMVRHFRTELAKAVLEGFPAEDDDAFRRACFDEFVGIARRYCNRRVLYALPVRERIVCFLIRQGRYETLRALAPALARSVQAPVAVDGGVLHIAYPGFRDQEFGVPDRIYTAGAGSCVQCSLVAAEATGPDCTLDFTARILVSNDPVEAVRLVCMRSDPRRRDVVIEVDPAAVTPADVRQYEFRVAAERLLGSVERSGSASEKVAIEIVLSGHRIETSVHYLESAKSAIDRWQAERAGRVSGTDVRLLRDESGDVFVRVGAEPKATNRYLRGLRRKARMLRLVLKRFL